MIVTFGVMILMCSVIFSISYVMYQINQQPPETIEIHRYYNEESQVECFYHQNAISCLWVMGEVK